jgi:hypothetical protein
VCLRGSALRHLIRDGANGHRPVVSAFVVRESGLLRDLVAGRRFLRLGAAEGGDTCDVEGSLMKLRGCAGYLCACHDHRESQPRSARQGLKGGRMCAQGV